MSHYKEQREQESIKRQKRLEELRKQAAELDEEIKKLEAVKVWDPVVGDWFICADGVIHNGSSTKLYNRFGTERQSREQAEKARDKMRVFNRLLAYVDEFSNSSECNYYYIATDKNGEYDWHRCESMNISLCTIYMPKQVAIDLCAKLNSGEVVL